MEKYSKRFVFLLHALFVKAESGDTNTKYLVDNGIYVAKNYFPHVKYSYIRSVFFRFYVYLCHVIDNFTCFYDNEKVFCFIYLNN